MESHLKCKGFMVYLMIGFAASRPQYNYQSSSSGQSFNLASGSNNNQITQIVASQPLTQTYIPPVQQIHSAVQSQFPPAAPVPQYLPPTQSLSSSVSSGQQVFRDISQLPLQNSNSLAFGGQSNSVQSLIGQSSFNAGQSQILSNGFSSGVIGQSQGISGGLNGQYQGTSTSINQQASFRPQQRTIVTKDIFVHTAPPDAEEELDFNKQLESVPIRKNYRIIFIKAPTQNLRIAAEALKQAQAINQEKTVIYVLSKKSDVADLQKQISQIQAPQTINQKPEVYFIKYKTNEEAQRAQQEIQAQYDKLGGSTSISNEGIAPVVGALNSGNILSSGSGQLGAIAAPAQKYLPAKV